MMTTTRAIFLSAIFVIVFGRTSNVVDRGLVSEEVSYTSILREQSRYHSLCSDGDHVEPTKIKYFNGTTLVYVTPWNNHGYDIAKTFSCKFDYVSPIWFNIRGGSGFTVDGDHNVDSGWIEEVKDNDCPNSFQTKLTPRYLFDGWSGEDYSRVIANKANDQSKLAKLIVNSCKKHSFDGLVLEGGALIPLEYRKMLIPFYKLLGSELHKEKMKFVLVQGPKREGSPSFSEKEMAELGEDVDYISLMTYDYSTSGPGPNSPIGWMTSAVLSMIPPESRSDLKSTGKILMGVPFYGYVHNNEDPRGSKSILGKDFVALLRKIKPEIQWEDESKEHKVAYDQQGSQMVAYYPSLKFIKERLELASSLGTGISIWEIGQGLDYFYDLL